MTTDRGAGLADASSARVPGRCGRQLAQQSGKADAACVSLRLQLVAHVVIQPDRDWHPHGYPHEVLCYATTL